VGDVSVNWLQTVFVLAAAFLAVFWEAAFGGVRHLLGAQIDLLPALMVYAGLFSGITTVTLLAVCGGLWFDSLSANPLGVSMLPLFVVGLVIHVKRDLILRDQTFAQVVLGFGASAATPVLTLLLLLTTRHAPLLGWGTLWQLVVMSAGGAIATPICCELFSWLNRTLVHRHAGETSFRADREIRRGKG
jgi:cell shape-determining protein MreD